MAHIRAKDTKPELIVRSMVRRMGYRFRLHRRDLPGAPDLVFPRLKAVIFVHGCFWHGCPLHGTTPSTRRSYWAPKLAANKARDRRIERSLRRRGWRVMRIWEHSVRRDPDR